MPNTSHHLVLSVLFFQEGDAWVAQGLEHDIAAHGQSMDDAKIAFERTVTGYFQLAAKHQREPLASLRPAPSVFWEVWKRVVAQRTLEAEPFPSIDAYMIPAITTEQIRHVN